MTLPSGRHTDIVTERSLRATASCCAAARPRSARPGMAGSASPTRKRRPRPEPGTICPIRATRSRSPASAWPRGRPWSDIASRWKGRTPDGRCPADTGRGAGLRQVRAGPAGPAGPASRSPAMAPAPAGPESFLSPRDAPRSGAMLTTAGGCGADPGHRRRRAVLADRRSGDGDGDGDGDGEAKLRPGHFLRLSVPGGGAGSELSREGELARWLVITRAPRQSRSCAPNAGHAPAAPPLGFIAHAKRQSGAKNGDGKKCRPRSPSARLRQGSSHSAGRGA